MTDKALSNAIDSVLLAMKAVRTDIINLELPEHASQEVVQWQYAKAGIQVLTRLQDAVCAMCKLYDQTQTSEVGK